MWIQRLFWAIFWQFREFGSPMECSFQLSPWHLTWIVCYPSHTCNHLRIEPRLRNAKAALKRLRHVEATVSCYTIQGITLQCIWCLMMLKTKATLVTVPCFGSKELPIEWKSWNCDEPPPPTRGGVGDKELQGPGAKVGWEGWRTAESGVA